MIIYIVVHIGVLGHQEIIDGYEDETEALKAANSDIMRKVIPLGIVPREKL